MSIQAGRILETVWWYKASKLQHWACCGRVTAWTWLTDNGVDNWQHQHTT